ARNLQRAEDETEKCADRADEQCRSRGLGNRRVQRAAPEVIPADDHERGGYEVRRIAEQLERQFGDESADAAGEVRGSGVRAGAEEPDGVGWFVAGERHDPDERGGKQRDADELADATGYLRSTHRSDLHDDGQDERPPSRAFAKEPAQLDAEPLFDQPLIGTLLDAGLLDDLAEQPRPV